MIDKNIYTLLVSGHISSDEFIDRYSIGKNINEEHFVNLFNISIQNEDAELLEESFIATEAFNCFSSRFSDVLCALLSLSWHYKHEDIARTLQKIKDPGTVNCLFNSCLLEFDYLDYDDTFQFARKCIKALSAIDSVEANNKLMLLAESENDTIKEYAIKELRYKQLI